MLNNLILSLDIFYLTPKFFISEKEKFRTIIGAIFSLFTLTSIICLSGYFLYQVFARTEVTVIGNNSYETKFSLNHTNLPFMFGLFDLLGNPMNYTSEVYYFDARYIKSETSEDFNEKGEKYLKNSIKSIPLELCDINKHFGNYTSYFKNIPNLNSWYCLIPNKNNLTIFGKQGGIDGSSIFEINLFKCKNTTKNKNRCIDKESINNIVENSFLTLGFLDFDIDHNNVYEPNRLNIKTQAQRLSSTLSRRYAMKKSNVKYVSDLGIFLESYVTKEFFIHESTDIGYDIFTENDSRGSQFAGIVIMLSGKTYEFSRNYTKIQNCLANIGGIIKGILTVVSFILSFITDKIFYTEFVNKICLNNLNNSNFCENKKKNHIKLINDTINPPINMFNNL